jgi:hypothetical protein
MKTMIGIFQGKEATNNKFLLENLYNNGPLTAWELTKTIRERNRMSIHAIFNKRLRILEKKGYVQKAGKKWTLHFKGIIAVLIIQPEPKPWNEKWTNIVSQFVSKAVNEKKKIVFKDKNNKFSFDGTEFMKGVPTVLGEFERWVALANGVKKLMEKGIINLDVISNESLFMFVATELGE